LICGTGVGMSIAANRVKGIRAGLVSKNEIARLIRQHNNANVLVLPGRFMDEEEAIKSVKIFIETEFEAGRHQARIDKI
jgi:sugar-phosphate isomerases, RpiB/LacA/LacB family